MELQEVYFILCDFAQVSERKKVTLIGVFDKIYVEGTPAFHSAASFAANYKVVSLPGDRRIEFRLEVSAPGGDDLTNGTVRLSKEYAENEQNIGVIFNLNQMPLPELGKYITRLYANDTQISKLEFDVEQFQESE